MGISKKEEEEKKDEKVVLQIFPIDDDDPEGKPCDSYVFDNEKEAENWVSDSVYADGKYSYLITLVSEL